MNAKLMMKIKERINPTKPVKSDNTTQFVSFPVKPVLNKPSNGSIFHDQDNTTDKSLDDMLWTSLKKHFLKASAKQNKTQSTILEQSSEVI